MTALHFRLVVTLQVVAAHGPTEPLSKCTCGFRSRHVPALQGHRSLVVIDKKEVLEQLPVNSTICLT